MQRHSEYGEGIAQGAKTYAKWHVIQGVKNICKRAYIKNRRNRAGMSQKFAILTHTTYPEDNVLPLLLLFLDANIFLHRVGLFYSITHGCSIIWACFFPDDIQYVCHIDWRLPDTWLGAFLCAPGPYICCPLCFFIFYWIFNVYGGNFGLAATNELLLLWTGGVCHFLSFHFHFPYFPIRGYRITELAG